MHSNQFDLHKALGKLNIWSLNEIQEATIQSFQEHQNNVLLAPTGSGKTLAFLIPLLGLLKPELPKVQALILAPSRELAMQIEQVFRSLSTGIKVNCFYGGHPFKAEKDTLNHPPALLIGTPGRVADHLRRGTFDTSEIKTLVLDEFDKALELGFEDEMKFIIDHLENLNKRMLTSATRMETIPTFTRIKEYKELNFLKNTSPEGLTLKSVRSLGDDKLQALFLLLCKIGNAPTLVFCNHREAVDRISQILADRNIKHDIFHGGLKQEERERALAKFRNGSYNILISTDLASRGLDIPAIEHVVHYQLATTQEAFVHRNGRTARMYAKGTAYLILGENDYIPTYIDDSPEQVELDNTIDLPESPNWTTVYIGGGKKAKISKGDVAGFLMQKGNLEKEDIGLIEVQDFCTYVAVNSLKVRKAVSLLRNEKIKKQKLKIDISW